MIKAIR